VRASVFRFDILTPKTGTRYQKKPDAIFYFFALRFVRFFAMVGGFSIRKSSGLCPAFIASASQGGCAPRPAHVSPDRLRYFGSTFRPFNLLAPCLDEHSHPTPAVAPLTRFGVEQALHISHKATTELGSDALGLGVVGCSSTRRLSHTL
jgi:hypothetical protein